MVALMYELGHLIYERSHEGLIHATIGADQRGGTHLGYDDMTRVEDVTHQRCAPHRGAACPRYRG